MFLSRETRHGGLFPPHRGRTASCGARPGRPPGALTVFLATRHSPSAMLWYRTSVFRSFEASGAALGRGSICFPPARRCLITQTHSGTRHGVSDTNNCAGLPNPSGGWGRHRSAHTRTSPSRVRLVAARGSGRGSRAQAGASRRPRRAEPAGIRREGGTGRSPHGRPVTPLTRGPPHSARCPQPITARPSCRRGQWRRSPPGAGAGRSPPPRVTRPCDMSRV